MVVYDVECQVKFDREVSNPQRVAFRKAAGGGRIGWQGPGPVVNWTDSGEALVLLVMHAPPPDEAPPDETLCSSAKTQIAAWAEESGIVLDPQQNGLIVECTASARI